MSALEMVREIIAERDMLKVKLAEAERRSALWEAIAESRWRMMLKIRDAETAIGDLEPISPESLAKMRREVEK